MNFAHQPLAFGEWLRVVVTFQALLSNLHATPFPHKQGFASSKDTILSFPDLIFACIFLLLFFKQLPNSQQVVLYILVTQISAPENYLKRKGRHKHEENKYCLLFL